LNLNCIRVYIKPFDIDGNYTTFQEVTKYVKSIGNISSEIDSADYNIGIYRNSNVSINLNNRNGEFSDIEVLQSIFRYKRKDSIVKITYAGFEYGFQCGTVSCGSRGLSEELTLFEGLLNDESYRLDAENEDAKFTILGYESLFDRVEVPYASLSGGDTVSDIIYTILNQTEITSLLTISSGNINPDVDQASDDISWLENKTVSDALDKLLLISNSVLYIKSGIVYVSARDPGTMLAYTFYGQAAATGSENIMKLSNYNNGAQRIFNLFTWKDSVALSRDADSININGAKKVELDFEVYTNTTKQENFMDALLAEFKDAKKELELETMLTYDTLALNILDKVNIDYPTVYYAEGDNELPVCGVAICGEAILPIGLWNLVISSDINFKILKKEYNLNNLIVKFKLREV